MALLDRLFARRNENRAMQPLYERIVATAREPHWYIEGKVADTVDGRFDMLAAVLSLVTLRMEALGNRETEQIWLTELFVADMDGNLREIGIGDLVVGKHVGRMMGALGGRISAYREGVRSHQAMAAAVARNIFRGEPVADTALAHVVDRLLALHDRLALLDWEALAAGGWDSSQ